MPASAPRPPLLKRKARGLLSAPLRTKAFYIVIELYYYPSYISLVPHILLHEIGSDHRLIFVDRHAGAHKREPYLTLNPNGLIPVLRDGDLVLYEAAAIALHLADRHPDSLLAPAVGTNARAHFYKWLMWLASSLHPALSNYLHPNKWMADEAAQARLRAGAEARIAELFDIIDAELARHERPWLLGETFSVLDAYAFVLCRWSRRMARPGASWPKFGPYAHRIAERPAVLRALRAEHLSEPWI
jgi:glutathione S-transferase